MLRHPDAVAASAIVLGLVLRLAQAAQVCLNPDEAVYFFQAVPSNLKQLYFSTREIHHPPLLVFLVHLVMGISTAEWALRLVPALAGSLYPWVVYRWLGKAWNQGAGMAALLILTFSPNLVALSAQVRGYTLVLLFSALALLFLEGALDRGSVSWMILFTSSLYLAILSEYSAAWVAGAAGIYFLLRAGERGVSRRLVVVWALGQAGALAICAFLYWTSAHLQANDPGRDALLDRYLLYAFPQPNESILVFSARGTLKQLAYTFSSIPLGVLAAAAFAAGLVLLWKGRSRAESRRTRALVALLVAPFLLGCAAATLRGHPYGRTRHTVIMSVFIAAGVGVALERLLRSRARLAAAAALVFLPVWHLVAEPDRYNISRDRQRRPSMIRAVDHLRSSVPPGSLILTTQQARLLLGYYLGSQRVQAAKVADVPVRETLGGFRVVSYHWDFAKVDRFLEDLGTVRRELGLRPSEPLWVIEGGFEFGIHTLLRQRNPGLQLPELRDFDGALVVFRAPPEL